MGTSRKGAACCVVGCCSRRGDQDIAMHSFPIDSTKAEIWKLRCGVTGSCRYKFVCSRHFLATDYRDHFKKRLIHGCVPSVNLNVVGSDSFVGRSNRHFSFMPKLVNIPNFTIRVPRDAMNLVIQPPETVSC